MRLFFLYSLFSLKTVMQARAGILLFVIGKALRVIFLFVFLIILFQNTRLIKGYSFSQLVVFYLTYNLIDTCSQIIFREVYRFRPLVVSGEFDMVLLKPFHPFIKILIGGIDFIDIVFLIPYIFGIAYMIGRLPNINIFTITLYLGLLINTFIIATSFHILVLAIGILTTEVDHTIMIYRDITALGRFPIDIYQNPFKDIFTFIIPIGIMMTFPSYALFGLLSNTMLLISCIISAILLIFSLYTWNYALKKYQSWGG